MFEESGARWFGRGGARGSSQRDALSPNAIASTVASRLGRVAKSGSEEEGPACLRNQSSVVPAVQVVLFQSVGAAEQQGFCQNGFMHLIGEIMIK